MALAINSFAEIKAERKVCILGDMLELGEKSEDEHIRILQMLQQEKDEVVILVGIQFQKVSTSFGYKSFTDTNQLSEYLKNNPTRNSSILIKGSRGIALEKIYPLL